jgi:hypothetical protein
MKISSLYPTLISTNQSLKQQVRTRGGQRWKIELDYLNRTRSQMAPLRAFMLSLRGQFNTCTFAMPAGSLDTSLGSWAGAPKVNGASQLGRSILCKGFTPSQTGVAKADDFVQFASDLKVYVVVADANSDGSGNATLSIEPALMQSPADNSSLVFGTSILFTLASEADLIEFPCRPPFFSDYSTSLIERV